MLYSETELKNELAGTLERAGEYLNQLRTGRPNPEVFEGLMVDAYGSKINLKSVATVGVVEGNIVISPFDKSLSKAIAKAIIDSPLGFNPTDEGSRVRVSIPPMTQETRQATVDQMEERVENDFRKNIRQIRQHYMQKVDAAVGVSEDQQEISRKAIQKLVDETMSKLNGMTDAKDKDIMSLK